MVSTVASKSQTFCERYFYRWALGMHQISGSGLPDIRTFFISRSGSGGKLPDSEPYYLLIYCPELQSPCLTSFRLSLCFKFSTLNIQYTYSVFEFNQCVTVCAWWFVIMCMQSNFVLFAYNPLSQYSDRNLGNKLWIE